MSLAEKLDPKSKRAHQVSRAQEMISHDMDRVYQWMQFSRQVAEDTSLPTETYNQYVSGVNSFLLHLRTEIERLEKHLPEIDTKPIKGMYNILEQEAKRAYRK